MTRRQLNPFTGFLPLLFALLLNANEHAEPSEFAAEPQLIQFEQDIQPILSRNCYRCHGPQNQKGGLRLDQRVEAMATADSGEPIITAGQPDHSLLLQRIRNDDAGERMPPDAQALSDSEIQTLENWIVSGANWPETKSDSAATMHWAYRPIHRPALPIIANRPDDHSPLQNPIDLFVRQKLAGRRLELNRPADRRRLMRRVTLALTGLPPDVNDVEAFVQDTAADAFDKLVQRLLDSPRFGERWAVPWLDLARYADSNGFQADQIRDNWAYRDWVIKALNDGMPYDQFIIEQLAGDLLPNATLDQRIATGFHRMTTCNVEAGVDPEANRINQVVDRVNTTATVFLGTTLECAQCHDHKYDPFTQEDYYGLFAYFNNTPLEVKNTADVTWDFYGPKLDLPQSLEQQQKYRSLQDELVRLRTEKERIAERGVTSPAPVLTDVANGANPEVAPSEKDNATATEGEQKQLNQRIKDLEKQLAKLAPDSTLVMEEMQTRRETFIMQRGDYQSLGASVQPHTPAILPVARNRESRGDRLELAWWLTSDENPLTARVTVNRWWAELFGRGLVATLEDFGSQAEAPSHPELLDWLAAELIESGWSMKHVLKLIVTSATYQQSAVAAADRLQFDPDNRWLSRGPRLRMRAETVRDNALGVSGLLSPAMFGPPVMPYQPPRVWRSVGRNQPVWNAEQDERRFRRGVYVIWKRAAPYPSFVNFDAPDRSSCTVRR
ncbi:MAG: PSD1 domain-containing protein, partial [Planctomycetales bacterium]|nr:PSD1 domain-containing protein [Planctomycetales bacterium]